MTTSSGSSGGSSSSSSSSSDSPKKSGVGSASRSGSDGGVVKTMSNPDSITYGSDSATTDYKTGNIATGFLGTDLQKQDKPGTTVAPIAGSFAGSSMGGSGSDKVPGSGAEVPTTVTQPTSPGDGPESTTVTGNPRSDFSAVLAGLLGRRPNRGAAHSNNFISLVGSAGGLGRATATARRSLIGGA